MRTMKLVLIAAVFLSILLVILQNRTPIQGHFLWLTAEVPAILLLFFTAMGGVVLGLLVALFTKSDKSKHA